MHTFHSEILAFKISTIIRKLSPGLENNHKLKCLSIFQHNHIHHGLWKNAVPAFQCIILLQSNGQGLKKMRNYGTNMSPAFRMTLSPGLQNNITLKYGLAFFHRPCYIGLCWKNAKTTFQCMVDLQSRGQVSNSC